MQTLPLLRDSLMSTWFHALGHRQWMGLHTNSIYESRLPRALEKSVCDLTQAEGWYVLRLPRVNTLKSFHCLNRQRVNAILHNFCKGTLASTTRSLNHKFTEERPGIAIGKIEKGEILTATQIYCDHIIKDLNPKKKSYYSCPFPLHRVIQIHSWECYILIISQLHTTKSLC